MAGHNKWSKVKHIKGAADAKRGKIFSRLAREISIAARAGGGDPSMNARLRSAMLGGRASNMPNDTIERAIKKGLGELGGHQYEEILYEGYGPGGVALLIETATDNKNRTAADIRLVFSKNGGNLGTSGSVAYLFERKGELAGPAAGMSEDVLLECILEAGPDDLAVENDEFHITCPPENLCAIGEALRRAGLECTGQKLTYIPENTICIADAPTARQILRLCDALEDADDVQNIIANFEIDDTLADLLSDSISTTHFS